MTAFSMGTMLTIQQVAEILNLSNRTIKRRIQDSGNPMPFVNYGTPKRPNWRINPIALQNWTVSLKDTGKK